MSKLLLLSILPATFVLPALAARKGGARGGLRRAVGWMVAFEAAYGLALLSGGF